MRRALDELEVGGRAIHDVKDLSSGALRLGFTPSFAIYLLGPLIRRYRDRFPGIVLTITEVAQEEMELALGADALDVGLAFSDVKRPQLFDQAIIEFFGPLPFEKLDDGRASLQEFGSGQADGLGIE